MKVNKPLYFSSEDKAYLDNWLDDGINYYSHILNLENNTYTFPVEDIEDYARIKFETKYGKDSYSDYDSPEFDERIKEIYGIVRKQLESVLSKKYGRLMKALSMDNEPYW